MTKILLIDDDESEAPLLTIALKNYNVRILGMRSVLEALDVLDGFSPDVIVLDLNLSKHDGFDFLKLRSETPWLLAIPLLVSSGRGDVATITRSLSCGANGYMIKEWDLTKLIRELKKIGVPLEQLK